MMGAFQNGFGMGMHAFNSAMDRDRQEKRDALQAQYLGLQMDEMKDKAADREAQKKIEAIKSGTAAQNTEPQQGSVVDAAGGGRVFYKDANAAQAAAEDEAFIRDARSSLDKQKLESQAPPEAYQPSTPASPAPVIPRAGFGVTPLQNKAQVFDTQEGASKYAGLNPDSEYLRVKEMRDRVRASGLKGSDDEAEKLATRMAILKREGAFDAYQAALANNPEATNIWNNSGMHRLEEGTKFVPVDVKNEFGVVERRVQVVNKDGRVVIPDMATAIKAAVLAPDKYFSSIDKSDSYNSRLMTQLMLGSLRGVGGGGHSGLPGGSSGKGGGSALDTNDAAWKFATERLDAAFAGDTGSDASIKSTAQAALNAAVQHTPQLLDRSNVGHAIDAAIKFAKDPKSAPLVFNPNTATFERAVPGPLGANIVLQPNAVTWRDVTGDPKTGPLNEDMRKTVLDTIRTQAGSGYPELERAAFDPAAMRSVVSKSVQALRARDDFKALPPAQQEAKEREVENRVRETASWITSLQPGLKGKYAPPSAPAAAGAKTATSTTQTKTSGDPVVSARATLEKTRAGLNEASQALQKYRYNDRLQKSDPEGYQAAQAAFATTQERANQAKSAFDAVVKSDSGRTGYGLTGNEQFGLGM